MPLASHIQWLKTAASNHNISSPLRKEIDAKATEPIRVCFGAIYIFLCAPREFPKWTSVPYVHARVDIRARTLHAIFIECYSCMFPPTPLLTDWHGAALSFTMLFTAHCLADAFQMECGTWHSGAQHLARWLFHFFLGVLGDGCSCAAEERIKYFICCHVVMCWRARMCVKTLCIRYRALKSSSRVDSYREERRRDGWSCVGALGMGESMRCVLL